MCLEVQLADGMLHLARVLDVCLGADLWEHTLRAPFSGAGMWDGRRTADRLDPSGHRGFSVAVGVEARSALSGVPFWRHGGRRHGLKGLCNVIRY